VTGIGTVTTDNPSMNARLEDEQVLQPLRVVLDSKLTINSDAKMSALPGRTVVCTTSKDKKRIECIKTAGIDVVLLTEERGHISLPALMDYLNSEQINEVLVEAGNTLSGAFIQAGFVDELVVYMAPSLMGDTARGLFSLPGLEKMSDRVNLDIIDMKAVGKDWRITAKIH